MKKFILALALLFSAIVVPRETLATLSPCPSMGSYTGDGATTTFTYNCKIVDKTHIKVYVGTTVQVVDTNYTVTNVGATSGSIVFVTAPASNATVRFLRNIPIQQASTYKQNEAFPAGRVERDYDRLSMVDQMLQEQISRSLRYPESYNPGATVTAVPVPVPNRCLGWNSAGALAANECTGGGAVTGVFIDSLPLATSGSINFQDTGTIDFTNPNGALVRAAVVPSSIGTTQLADDSVTYAKQQNISAASRLLGRGSAAGAGDPQEISLGTGLVMSGTTVGVDLAFSQITGTPSDAQIPDLNTLSTGLTASRCVETDITGKLTVSGAACSSGAGTGDIEGVTAGAGIGGGGNSGTVTMTWNPGSYVNNVTLWDSTQASRTLTAGLSGAADPVITFGNNYIEVTTGALMAGPGGSITATAFTSNNITSLAGISTVGFPAYVGGGIFQSRTITGVSGETAITFGTGELGNPLIGLADAFTLAGKTSTIPWKTGTTAPVTCSTGMAFFDTDAVAGTNLNLCTSANTWTTISGSGSGTGHQIQEEGAGLTARAGLNFIGNSVTAADDSGNNRTNVTISQTPAASTSLVGSGRTITTNSPLGGGGNLTGDLTLTCSTCATTATTAAGEVAVMTSATGIRSYSTLKYDGTDLSIGNVATNYARLVTAALTGNRTITAPDADSVTVIPATATSNQFLTNITSGGVQTKAQPAFTNLSGTAQVSQGGTGLTTVAANRLLGTGGSVDGVQAITVGSGLTLAAGTLSATGGAGTPGGATTQIQFNDSGAFLGTQDFTVDKNNVTMGIGVEVVDYDNSPLLTLDHDGTWGIVSTAGTGTGAANIGLKLTTEGTGRVRVGSLATTGAATGKTVVCADANGDLYRSSTGTDCSN